MNSAAPGKNGETSSSPFVVLCFGDDETWGSMPGTDGRRFDTPQRWPSVIRRELGPGFHVIEDALPGRMTVWENPLLGDRNGLRHLEVSLQCHHPIDLVILMIGKSDLTPRFNLDPRTIREGIDLLISKVFTSEPWPGAGSPQLLLVAPPVGGAMREPDKDSEELLTRSRELVSHIAELAQRRRTLFLDSNDVVEASGIAGRNLDVDSHELLGKSIAQVAAAALSST